MLDIKCSCVQRCPMVYQPVCASDDKSYGSRCLLEQAACVGKKKINVLSAGFCSKLIYIFCSYVGS